MAILLGMSFSSLIAARQKEVDNAYDRANEARRLRLLAEKRLADLKANSLRVGTHIFRSRLEAERYFGGPVDTKLAEKTIEINPWPGRSDLATWDASGRLVRPLLYAQILDAEFDVTRYSADCERWCDIAQTAQHQINALRRMACAPKPEEVRVSSKAALERALKRACSNQWTRELPYCCAGFPIFSKEQYENEYNAPENNRAFRIALGDRPPVTLYVLRNILGPSGPVWGMRDGPRSLLCAQVDVVTVKFFDSSREVLRHILPA